VTRPATGRLRPRTAALAALAFIALVWGYNWVVMKEAMRYASPFEFLSWRFAIAMLCLFGTLVALGRPLRLTHVPAVLWIGLLQTTATFGLTTWALVSGAAGKSAVLAYTMPFWVTLFAWPLLANRPSPAQWSALGIALAGLLLLIGPALRPGVPELLALASGIVITKRLTTRHRVDVLALSAWQTLLGGGALIALALAFPGAPTQWSPYLVFAVLFNGIVVSALCWFLWFWVLGKLDAGTASLGTLAVPVLGVLLGVLELGERPSALEWSGIALVVAALALAGVAAQRR
jgi:drug/metabolite transporter (DMT)-like permease